MRTGSLVLGVLLVFCIASVAQGSPTLVQKGQVEGAGVASLQFAFPAPNIAGNWIGVLIRSGTAANTVTVSDSASNHYQQAFGVANKGASNQVFLFYASNVAGTSNTVTVTFSAADPHAYLGVVEYTGMAATATLDRAGVATFNSAAACNATISTNAANELLLGGLEFNTSSAATVVPGLGYTVELSDTIGSSYHSHTAWEDQFAATTGTFSTGWALSASTAGACGIASFTTVASGGVPAPLAITTSSLPNGQAGSVYSATLVATGGTTPYTWSIVSGALPPGLTLNASTGAITGTPSQAGTYNFTVQVADSEPVPQVAKQAEGVTINPAPLQITTTSLPNGMVGISYSASLSATGGAPPYSWTVLSGQIPPGLSVSTTGMISGTPTTVGVFTFVVQVKDSLGATSSNTFSITTASSCGGPLTYCSRTDLETVQLPRPIPNVGNLTGANAIVVDPDFNNHIVRVTDANTNPSSPNVTFSTSSSADDNAWNLDSTMFLAGDANGAAYPFSFNPATMQASRLYASSYPATGGYTSPLNGESFSHTNRTVYYGIEGNGVPAFDQIDLSTNPPTQAQVFNFITGSPNCLPSTWGNYIWPDWGGSSGDDSTFVAAFSNTGAQGTGVDIVVYKSGMGCRHLNTASGQVTGDWGSTGTISIPDRFTIHNVKISKDGNWLVIVETTCTSVSCQGGPYFWNLSNLTVNACGTNACTGHWTEGYTHWINNSSSQIAQQLIRSFSNVSSYTGEITNFPSGLASPFDMHQAWNNVMSADNDPIFMSTFSTTSPFPAAWYNEILGVATDGSGMVWRFAHNFITANSQRFATSQGIGTVSQDGKFFIFSSDWMGTLGSETGASTCTVGTDCRGDVFIVQLGLDTQPSNVSLSTASLSFGSQAVGTSSSPQTATLTNNGSSALSITSIVITGTNSSDFTQTNTCGSSVGIGGKCTISVTFTPTASGTRAAAVTIMDTDPSSPQTVGLTGTAPTTASVSPTSLSFGNQTVASTSPAQPVTLTNTGGSTLTISTISIDNNFAQTNNCPANVISSCTFQVTFTPATSGPFTGTLSITDSASNSPQAVTLTGTGVTPVVQGSPSLVQKGQVEGAGVASLQFAFPAPNTAGNWIGVLIRSGTAANTVTVSDSASNHYQQAFGVANKGASNQVFLFYASNVAGTSNTVTVTFSAADPHAYLGVVEYTGMAATATLDRAGVATFNSAAACNATISTNAANELLLGGLEFNTSSAATVVPGAGYTVELSDTIGSSYHSHTAWEDQFAATTGTFSTGWALSASTAGACGIASFH